MESDMSGTASVLRLALVAGLAGCGAVATALEEKYTLAWTFINNSCNDVWFHGVGDPRDAVTVKVLAGMTATGTSGGPWNWPASGEATKYLAVEVKDGPGDNARELSSRKSFEVRIYPSQTTAVPAAVWAGDDFYLSENPNGFTGPTEWELACVSGNPAFSHDSEWETTIGYLSFVPPEEIEEGRTYQLSSTFDETVTAKPGRYGGTYHIPQGIRDESWPPGYLDARKSTLLAMLTEANPTASASATITAAWTIPAANHNRDEISLVAWAWNDPGFPGPPGAKLVAIYRRVR
jgi:hypothetical protein